MIGMPGCNPGTCLLFRGISSAPLGSHGLHLHAQVMHRTCYAARRVVFLMDWPLPFSVPDNVDSQPSAASRRAPTPKASTLFLETAAGALLGWQTLMAGAHVTDACVHTHHDANSDCDGSSLCPRRAALRGLLAASSAHPELTTLRRTRDYWSFGSGDFGLLMLAMQESSPGQALMELVDAARQAVPGHGPFRVSRISFYTAPRRALHHNSFHHPGALSLQDAFPASSVCTYRHGTGLMYSCV